ncbi:rpoE leader peptide RseD [Escherichia coli]
MLAQIAANGWRFDSAWKFGLGRLYLG